MLTILWGIALWLLVGCLLGVLTLGLWSTKRKWTPRMEKFNFCVMVPLGPLGLIVVIIRSVMED